MSTKTKAVAPTLRTNKYNLEKFKTDVLGWCLILPALAIICFYTIWPMIGAIQLAFSKTKGFTVVEWCGFQNFKDVLRHPNFLQALKNSVSYTIWSLIIGLLVPVVIAALTLLVGDHRFNGAGMDMALAAVAGNTDWYFPVLYLHIDSISTIINLLRRDQIEYKFK